MLLAIFVLAAAFLHDALAWQHSQVFSKIGERSRIDFSSFFSNVKKYNQRDVSLSESESSFGLSEELLSSSDDDSRKLKIEVFKIFYSSFFYNNCIINLDLQVVFSICA